jgi:hypothetical protein
MICDSRLAAERMQFNQSKRREFIAALGATVAWPAAVRGQAGKPRRIGLLAPGTASTQGAWFAEFVHRLHEPCPMGRISRTCSGAPVIILTRFCAGPSRGDIPVEQTSKFDLVINLTTAKALGLAIPEPFLLRADEVIE